MAPGKACRDWLTASRSAASRARVTASRAVLRGEPADTAGVSAAQRHSAAPAPRQDNPRFHDMIVGACRCRFRAAARAAVHHPVAVSVNVKPIPKYPALPEGAAAAIGLLVLVLASVSTGLIKAQPLRALGVELLAFGFTGWTPQLMSARAALRITPATLAMAGVRAAFRPGRRGPHADRRRPTGRRQPIRVRRARRRRHRRVRRGHPQRLGPPSRNAPLAQPPGPARKPNPR